MGKAGPEGQGMGVSLPLSELVWASLLLMDRYIVMTSIALWELEVVLVLVLEIWTVVISRHFVSDVLGTIGMLVPLVL